MKTISLSGIWPRKDFAHPTNKKLTIAGLVLCLTLGFLLCGRLLQHIDFMAAILDIGILSVLLFGILALVVAIFCSLWLQEILWKAFKTYRNNDRRRVDAYLRYTHWGKAHACCAAFVSCCYAQAGKSIPRNAQRLARFPKARQYKFAFTDEYVPAPTDVFGIYHVAAKQINHVGLVRSVTGSYILTIGGHVDNRLQAKRRLKSGIAVYANWIDRL